MKLGYWALAKRTRHDINSGLDGIKKKIQSATIISWIHVDEGAAWAREQAIPFHLILWKQLNQKISLLPKANVCLLLRDYIAPCWHCTSRRSNWRVREVFSVLKVSMSVCFCMRLSVRLWSRASNSVVVLDDSCLAVSCCLSRPISCSLSSIRLESVVFCFRSSSLRYCISC